MPAYFPPIQALASVAHKWINAISGAGVASATQPAATDISGLAASATTDTTNASNISSGTLSNSRLSAVPNSALANSAITIQGNSVSLGGTATVVIPLAFSGGTGTQSAGTTALYGGGLSSSGGIGSSVTVPVSGTMGNLWVNFENAPGSGQSYTATLYENNFGPTTITGQTTASSGTPTVSDTTHTLSISAGAMIFLEVVTSSGAAPLTGLSWGFTVSA